MIQLKGQASANMSTVMTVKAGCTTQTVSFSYFTIKARCSCEVSPHLWVLLAVLCTAVELNSQAEEIGY